MRRNEAGRVERWIAYNAGITRQTTRHAAAMADPDTLAHRTTADRFDRRPSCVCARGLRRFQI
jgi:predicted transcriptional regulator